MIQGIVLAAGLGRRLGGPKALLLLDGVTFHGRAAKTLRLAGLGFVVVTNAVVSEALPAPVQGESRVLNPDPDRPPGMFGSVRLGVASALKGGAEGVILLPVDYPRVTSEDVGAVASGLRAGGAVVVPNHEGRRGHPIGLGWAVMEEIAADPALLTLRDVVRRDPDRVVEVAASAGILEGVNTEEDLKRVAARSFR